MSVHYDYTNGESISFTIRKPSSKALSSSATIRNIDSKNLTSSFIIRRSSTKDLSASFTVRNIGFKALSSSATIRNIGSKNLSSSFIIRKPASKDGVSSSFTIRKTTTKDLSSSLTVKNKSSQGLSSNFWVNRASYSIKRVNHNTIQKEYGPLSIATGANYATVFEEDVEGYTNISIIVAAGDPNDITYRIQATTRELPNVWATMPSGIVVIGGVAVMSTWEGDVTASDPENMGVVAIFRGSFQKIRLQAKQKINPGRAWGTLRATMGGA